ncbi:unnamed protein product [Peniophora sp. CBMAI 1063]|nr:unnamed protein product [Peniophora sp. CBMAI 1063]
MDVPVKADERGIRSFRTAPPEFASYHHAPAPAHAYVIHLTLKIHPEDILCVAVTFNTRTIDGNKQLEYTTLLERRSAPVRLLNNRVPTLRSDYDATQSFTIILGDILQPDLLKQPSLCLDGIRKELALDLRKHARAIGLPTSGPPPGVVLSMSNKMTATERGHQRAG